MMLPTAIAGICIEYEDASISDRLQICHGIDVAIDFAKFREGHLCATRDHIATMDSSELSVTSVGTREEAPFEALSQTDPLPRGRRAPASNAARTQTRRRAQPRLVLAGRHRPHRVLPLDVFSMTDSGRVPQSELP